jgi:hypothetical protein
VAMLAADVVIGDLAPALLLCSQRSQVGPVLHAPLDRLPEETVAVLHRLYSQRIASVGGAWLRLPHPHKVCPHVHVPLGLSIVPAFTQLFVVFTVFSCASTCLFASPRCYCLAITSGLSMLMAKGGFSTHRHSQKKIPPISNSLVPRQSLA